MLSQKLEETEEHISLVNMVRLNTEACLCAREGLHASHKERALYSKVPSPPCDDRGGMYDLGPAFVGHSQKRFTI